MPRGALLPRLTACLYEVSRRRRNDVAVHAIPLRRTSFARTDVVHPLFARSNRGAPLPQRARGLGLGFGRLAVDLDEHARKLVQQFACQEAEWSDLHGEPVTGGRVRVGGPDRGLLE